MGLFGIFNQETNKLGNEVLSSFEMLIIGALQLITQFIARIIKGVLNFFRDIVNRFKNMYLQATQYPFVTTKQVVEPLIQKTPNVPYAPNAVFSAVYDEKTDEVVMGEYVGADSLDADTNNVFRGHKLRVLN